MANKKITELMAGTPTRDSLIESATDVGGTMVSRKFKVGAVADVNNVQIASEYDDTSTYAYGDYCIYEGVLYRCTTAISVAEAWTSAHWTAVMVTGEYKRVRIMTKAQFDLLSNDEKDGFIYVSDYPTKIQDIDNVSLTTSDNNKLLGVSVSGSDISVEGVEISSIKSSMILGNFAVYSAERIMNDSSKTIPLTQNLFVLFFKSYSQAGCFGAYLISYHSSVSSSQYISTLVQGTSHMPSLSISGSNLIITTGSTDVYYSMLRLN